MINNSSRTIGIHKGYYIGSDCAMVLLDVTSDETCYEVPKLYNALKQLLPGKPVVICGSKTDMPNSRVVYPANIEDNFDEDVPYFDVSTKTMYQLRKPFLYIMRVLTGNNRLGIYK